jgi:hypothetical protein
MDNFEEEKEDEMPVKALTPNNVDDVRSLLESLTASDKLDKDAALQITRLFHAMELIFNRECNARDSKIAKLEADVIQQRLQTELDRLATRHIHEKNELLDTPGRGRRR